MTEEQCEFYRECECDCNGAIEKTECCECYRLHNFIKINPDKILGIKMYIFHIVFFWRI